MSISSHLITAGKEINHLHSLHHDWPFRNVTAHFGARNCASGFPSRAKRERLSGITLLWLNAMRRKPDRAFSQ